MTLTTTMILQAPVPIEKLWAKALADLCAEPDARDGEPEVLDGDSLVSRVTGQRERMTKPCQGLAAWLIMSWHPDGPLEPLLYEDELWPRGLIEVRWDTGYGTKDRRELHRRLTASLGEWLDGQGCPWVAYDEFTGLWHERTPCPL